LCSRSSGRDSNSELPRIRHRSTNHYTAMSSVLVHFKTFCQLHRFFNIEWMDNCARIIGKLKEVVVAYFIALYRNVIEGTDEN
jgi:hypothetical protein